MFQFEKISVVIPVYNSASYISSTIDSVLSAYPKEYVDIVIVDDKSDDIENLKNVLRFYDSVRLIEKNTKSNAAESRNIGILKSFYDKVFLLDADDQFFLDYLINRVAIMNTSNAGVFFGSFIDVYNDGNRLLRCQLYRDEDIREYLFINSGDFRSSTISINKKFYKGTLFDEKQFKHQDWGFGIRCYDNGERLYYDSENFVEICHGKHSQMSSSMNIKASQYFVDTYLKKQDYCIIGFIRMHFSKSFCFGDKDAVIFFSTLIKKVNLITLQTLKLKVLGLLGTGLFFKPVSKILSVYVSLKQKKIN
ncbi:TPA: glycosyltransferase family 2 protein [Klebsiella oxytoca]|uniref:glycosyltransferase family 2 protein n=1 Tax=Klebsiella michiganensis TaxID=1134687 RepID=UPI002890AA84|nr:glycosyltransferase family 2 protein [Klebsiella oxytoca]HDY3614305.1 glycosyltransferase family 2 protein [Klebsiella oxytoca]